MADADVAALRKDVAALELRAEQIEHAMLYCDGASTRPATLCAPKRRCAATFQLWVAQERAGLDAPRLIEAALKLARVASQSPPKLRNFGSHRCDEERRNAATPMKWLAIAALATVCGRQCAQAQDYPARPIQVIVPFAGGSASDVVTRIMLDGWQVAGPAVHRRQPPGRRRQHRHAWRRPNGAGRLHAGDEHSRPLAANRTLFKSLGYDPEKDFAPISLFAILPNVVVINSKLPPKTLTELHRLCQAAAQGAQLRLGRGRQFAAPCRHLFRAGRGRSNSLTCRIAISPNTRPTSSPDRCRSASSSCPMSSGC
jgi:hypothetical protein